MKDDKNRLSVCISGQVALSILMNELRKVPTLKLVSLNTDSIQFEIDEDKIPLAETILKHWQKQYRLELERDDVIKLVMRDINNYATILETSKGKEVKFKGSCFASCPKIIIDENNRIITKYEPKFKANNLVIVSEALLKCLLFDIPVERTIMNCTDIRKFMIISHLGSTYEKCVQESPDGDILLQKNNRIYAGLKPSGAIIKVKPNGRRDSLPNQPPNPIVDNKNVISIEDINKAWYIKLARQWVNDFKGVRRLTKYKKDELLELASQKGLEVDKKTKKEELIKLLEESEEKEMATKIVEKDITTMSIDEKVFELKREFRQHDFVMDIANPANLGGKEYASIGQYYTVFQNLCDKYRLMFKWEVTRLEHFEKDAFKPAGRTPSNVVIVSCHATLGNLDSSMDEYGNKEAMTWDVMAGGSDIADKAVSGASTLAFRNWIDKNFTPKYLNQGGEEVVSSEEEKTQEPKIPTYIPPEKKEALVEKVVSEKQVETNEDRKQNVVNKIMEVREKLGNDTWGSNTVNQILTSEISEAELLSIELKVDNKLDSLK